jgi:hypothetical protein
MLFVVLSQEEKYKAKNVIDTVIYRSGDVLSAWAYTGLQALGLGLSAIAFHCRAGGLRLGVDLLPAWQNAGSTSNIRGGITMNANDHRISRRTFLSSLAAALASAWLVPLGLRAAGQPLFARPPSAKPRSARSSPPPAKPCRSSAWVRRELLRSAAERPPCPDSPRFCRPSSPTAANWSTLLPCTARRSKSSANC